VPRDGQEFITRDHCRDTDIIYMHLLQAVKLTMFAAKKACGTKLTQTVSVQSRMRAVEKLGRRNVMRMLPRGRKSIVMQVLFLITGETR